MTIQLEPSQIPNAGQYVVQTSRGDYVIQVAWPLCWTEDRVAPEGDPPVSTFYLVDGNAYFLTAVDVARRLEFTNGARAIVVGVGYPRTQYVYNWRRGPDLTPASPDGTYEMPVGRDGKPLAGVSFGEAERFLAFVEREVVAAVETRLFAHLARGTGRRALFGHSYGGVFALHALFTRPTLFDTFVAASPSLWWNRYFLARAQEPALRQRAPPADPPPAVVLTWGASARRRPGEPDDAFARRKEAAEDDRLEADAKALAQRLETYPSVRAVRTAQFEGEDHGSAAVAGLQRGIMTFLLEKE
ncbi:Alpha/Beta hydrolase protein [Durotheca rogersii]|uniref:Alpha/Beta hydrolase protein n=1 Tax=Durotheca rogersii TaxID=419775 RepID=UPI002221100A|nr:Alpha/Beta hydrolase protein [Durotheca rogersii]KAI5864844.1 Alpha/Beta hydrolase protein [Durotheca rogersii]